MPSSEVKVYAWISCHVIFSKQCFLACMEFDTLELPLLFKLLADCWIVIPYGHIFQRAVSLLSWGNFIPQIYPY